MELRLLGAVRMLVVGAEIDLGPARQRCVLAALAVHPDQVISVDRLTECVWGDCSPHRARQTLVSYLSRLRQVLAGAEGAIERRPGGYALAIEPSDVDLYRFRRLRSQARAETGRRAAELLEQALDQWQGEALAGLSGDWAEAERDRLHRERWDAEWDLTDALLGLGHGESLVAGLATRAAEHPLDERVAGQYLLALHRAGRTADALAHYRRLRDRLVEDLGTDPGTALRDTHQQILVGDPALAVPAREKPAGQVVTPRQLPAAPAPFVGRTDLLGQLDAVTTSGTVVIWALAGAGGIGKTALAVHWARRRLDRFPDGQLFLDLRGFSADGEVMDPATALRGLLATLGVEPGRIPDDAHAQGALFRSLVAGKRMLLLIDNAVDTSQVASLLPGSESCTVLVTSRNLLSGLLAGYGARPLRLDALVGVEARALLSGKLGEERIAAEPEAVDDLLRFCGGFPLALSIVAGLAQARPRLPLAALVAELREFGLGALDGGDPAASLPSVLSWSYRRMSPGQLTMLVLVGIAPGTDIDLRAIAALAGLPKEEARTVLLSLERASLIEQHAAGRFAMHDVIRRHAVDTARTLPEEVRSAALHRVVDFYLHSAYAADRIIDPHAPQVAIDDAAMGVDPVALADVSAASAWLSAEHDQLLAAQRTAAVQGRHEAAWQLAWVLTTFHLHQGLRHDALTVWLTALDAVEQMALADATIHIRTFRLLGYTYCELGRHDEGVGYLERALELAERHHDATEQAHVHRLLTRVWGYLGDFRRALDHAERTLDHFQAIDDPGMEAEALNAAGWCNAVLGDYDSARARCQAALDLFRRLRNIDGEAATLDSIAYIDHHSGRHDCAVSNYVRAVALQRELGDSRNEAETLEKLGHSQAALGHYQDAHETWRRAHELYVAQERDESARRVQQQIGVLHRPHRGTV